MESIVSFQRRLVSLERTGPQYQAYSDEMYLDTYNDGLGEGVGVGLGADDDDPAGGAVAAAGWVAGAEAYELEGPQFVLPAGGLDGRVAVGSVVPGGSIGARAASYIALRRRRQIFFGLLGSVVLSLGAAAGLGTMGAWVVHGVFSLLFLAYVYLLVRHHQRAQEHAAKVRYLSPIKAPRPAVVVLRSGSSAR